MFMNTRKGRKDTKMSDYPQADKVQEVREDSQMLGSFLEWLMEKYTLCRFYADDESAGYCQEYIDISRILAEYFGIDYDEYQNELVQILEDFRKKSDAQLLGESAENMKNVKSGKEAY